MSFPRRLLRFFGALCLSALFVCTASLQFAAADPLPTASGAMTARLRADVRYLASLPSRVPGTPGNKAAAAYVLQRFKDLGLSGVHAETYGVTAPVTRRAELTLGGRHLSIDPIYPNGVAPSTTPPAETLAKAARRMPIGSMPGWL